MTQKVQTHAPNRNCEPSNSSVKQSIRYITHGPIHCMDVLDTGSTSCALLDTWEMIRSVT